MADIFNLRRFRKARARSEAERAAEVNRAAHGRPKAERTAAATEAARAERRLEGHRLGPPKSGPVNPRLPDE